MRLITPLKFSAAAIGRRLVMSRAAATIGTHDGAFHCDEVLGCWMLKRLERFREAQITRTREPEILATMTAILDVGGIYDPSNLRFDHHQKGFEEVFGHGHTIKLSSAGLIYKHYGREILKAVLHPLETSEADLEALYLKVYRCFVEGIDGIDNGVSMCADKSTPLYQESTGLSSRVSRLNPAWNETDPTITPDGQFEKAMELCGGDFSSYVIHVTKGWLPAREHVLAALSERHEVSSSGEIVYLRQYCPWKEHLLELEKEQNLEGVIKYCIYTDGSGQEYRIQAVPLAVDSFESRIPMPAAWRALRSKDLDAATGIEKCVFVHAGGWIGANKTKEGALTMAEESLRQAKSAQE